MKVRFMKACAMLALIFAVVVTAGCQAVGGVDLNGAFQRMMEVQSSEGSGAITIEFKSDGASGPEADLLKAINPLTIRMDQVINESPERASLSGALVLPRGSVPFKMSVTPEVMVLQVDGAAKPIVFDLQETGAGSMALGAAPGLPGQDQQLMTELQKKLRDPALLKPVYGYLFKNMPNPKNTSFTSVKEKIHGEDLNLVKVGTELDGKELIPWIKGYLVKLMQDDQGLKAVVAQLYDALKPVLDEAAKKAAAAGEQPKPQPALPGADGSVPMPMSGMSGAAGLGLQQSFSSIVTGLLSDRDTAIEVLHTESKQVMVVLLAMLGQLEAPQNGAGTFLNDQNRFKGAIYVDSSLQVRRTDMELNFQLPQGSAEEGLSGLKVVSSFSNWNQGKAVKADILSTQDGIPANDMTRAEDLLRIVDPQSTLYKVLKQDFHVTRKTAQFPVSERYLEYFPAYSENGTAMVRANMLAPMLGLKTEWNAQDESLTLLAPATGKKITWTMGSSTAQANGAAVEAPASAMLKGNAAYVPLRATADALGAQITWNEQKKMVTVTLE
ncbi:copper amine oxidase N-terminal domain-containing protein [Gorillibacterium sp. sgz5001074]|uniref:copper amine oxidase N-terminal domain-containing protein n=1 Tax=Gorillibacterium sp. sgz5001074 TaxID=3446695 RepID=UPI003F668279